MGEFVKVTDSVEVVEGELAAFEVGGERIAVANVGGTLHAFGNTCTTSAARSLWASSRARP